MSHAVEAVIVAGGFGTRLLPLTSRRPKHLLNVGGVPFLEHQIARLAQAGIGRIVLATSYRAELFQPVLGTGGRWGVCLEFLREDQPRGTAGAIRNASGSLSDDPEAPVVVLNGDVLSGHDLIGQLADFERPRNGQEVDVSLHLVKVADARPFGCVPTDETGRVTAFTEKSDQPVTDQVNAGCYLFRRRLIDDIPTGRAVSVERETFPALVDDGRLVVGYVDTRYWRDVGTPAALVAASRDVVLGVALTPAIAPAPGGARVAESARVHGTATVDDGTVVDDHVRVGERARVSGSVVMAGAEVGAGAVLLGCAIGPGAVIGRDARLRAVTVGDDATVPEGASLGAVVVDCAATA